MMTSTKPTVHPRRGAKGMVLLLIMVVGVSAMGMSLALLERARWPGPLASNDEVQALAAKHSLKPLIEEWARTRLQKVSRTPQDSLVEMDLRVLLREEEAEDQFKKSKNGPLFRAMVRKEAPGRSKSAKFWEIELGQAGLSFYLIPPKVNTETEEKQHRLWVKWSVISPRRMLVEPGDPPSSRLEGVGLLRIEPEGIIFSAHNRSPLID
ncbi:MAG: hypothetical protein GY822_04560 [Deltaproteobacteria bacterium]|nr:hypothetical protein [Deltaproteobacteria bacterium]